MTPFSATWRSDVSFHPETGQPVAMMLPAVVKDIWRSDVDTPTSTPRTYTIASVSGSTITLTENRAGEIFSSDMRNVSMVRIWNTSKTPARSAWVNLDVAANAIGVHDAAAISGWAAGETIRLGDPNPTGTNTLQMIAIDISPYMLNNYGTVWRQRGLMFACDSQGVGGQVVMQWSGSGAVGTGFGSRSFPDGSRGSAILMSIFTTEQSPVSNSNLLFLRETIVTGTALAATRLARLVGIWV